MNKMLIATQIILILFLAGCGDKSEYAGELKNELPDGKGIMTYLDGSIYDGEWKEGQRYGEGTLTFEDGAKYEGEWKDGEMDGSEHSPGPMGTSMKGIGKMERRMGREQFFIRMEANWKVNSETTVLGTQLFTTNNTNIPF